VVGTALLGEDDLKFLIFKYIIDFLQVFFKVALLALKYELQQLEVEDDFVGVLIILKYFNLSILIHQVLIEEGRIAYCCNEKLSLHATHRSLVNL
jgi:hypothetical protein